MTWAKAVKFPCQNLVHMYFLLCLYCYSVFWSLLVSEKILVWAVMARTCIKVFKKSCPCVLMTKSMSWDKFCKYVAACVVQLCASAFSKCLLTRSFKSWSYPTDCVLTQIKQSNSCRKLRRTPSEDSSWLENVDTVQIFPFAGFMVLSIFM